MKVFAGIAGAVMFTVAMVMAQRAGHHLPTSDAIIYGVVAAAGFVLMAYSVGLRSMVVVDAGVILLVYFVFAPFLKPNRKDPLEEATQLYRADRYAEAVPLFESYLKAKPNDPLANARIGICLGQLGRLQEAIPYLRKAIDLDASDYQSRSNLGLVYEKLHRPEEGIEWERQADRIKPNDPAVLNNLGWVLMQAGHSGEAVGIFQRAVHLALGNDQYRTNLERARKEANE